MEQENRAKITVWLKPDIVQRMDGWLKADNCKSRGEFTEKALRFYMGYLATEDTSVFLSRTLVDTLQGIVADSHNRLRSMIFKWCVELNMMGHTIAAHFRADPSTAESCGPMPWMKCGAPTARSASTGRWISSAGSRMNRVTCSMYEQAPFHVTVSQGRRRQQHKDGKPYAVLRHPARRGSAPGGAG